MLRRSILNTNNGVPTSEREEKGNIWSIPKFAFSVVSLGATGIATVGIHNIVKTQWKGWQKGVEDYTKQHIPPKFLDILGDKKPKHRGATTDKSLMMHYARKFRQEGIEQATKYIGAYSGVDITSAQKFVGDTGINKSMMYVRALEEIEQLEKGFIGASNSIKNLYINNAIDITFPDAIGVNEHNIRTRLIDNPHKMSIYQDSLRRSLAIYNNNANKPISGELLTKVHEVAIANSKHTRELDSGIEYDIDNIKWAAPTSNNISISIKGNSYEAFSRDLDAMKGLGFFNKEAINIAAYGKAGIGKLHVADLKERLKTLYRSLKSSISDVYQNSSFDSTNRPDINDMFDISYELIDKGNNEGAMRLTIKATSVTPSDKNNPLIANKLGGVNPYNTHVIDIPVGSINDANLYTTIDNSRVVSSLIRHTLTDSLGNKRIEHANIPITFIDYLTQHKEGLARAITNNDGGRSLSYYRREAAEASTLHASMSGGNLQDSSVALSVIHPEIYGAAPTTRMNKSTRDRLLKSIRRLGEEKKSLAIKMGKTLFADRDYMWNIMNSKRTELESAIQVLKRRLEVSSGNSADRLMASYRMTMDAMSGDTWEGGIPWAIVGGGHIGKFSIISPYGRTMDPAIVNAQTQPYKLFNVYNRKSWEGDKSPIKYLHYDDNTNISNVTTEMMARARPRLPDESYKSVWEGQVIGNFYPFNQSEVVISDALRREMTNNIDAQDFRNIVVPKGAKVLDPGIDRLMMHLREIGAGTNEIRRDAIVAYLKDNPITINKGSKLYNSPGGDSVLERHQGVTGRVVDADIVEGKVILRLQRIFSENEPIRIIDYFGSIKAVGTVEKITSSLDRYKKYSGSIQLIARADYEKKLNMAQYDGMLVDGAFHEAIRKVEALEARGIDVTSLNDNIHKAAGLMNGTYVASQKTLFMQGHNIHDIKGVAFQNSIVNTISSLAPENVDEVLKLLGHVYDNDDEVIKYFAKNSNSMKEMSDYLHKKYKGDYSDDDIKKIIERWTPVAGGVMRMAVSRYGNMEMLTNLVMTRVGVSAQAANDISKVYGIGKPATEGIPYNFHEMPIIASRYLGISKEATTAAEKFGGHIIAQFGGKDAVSEYRDLFNLVSGKPSYIDPKKVFKLGKDSQFMGILRDIHKSLDSFVPGKGLPIGSPETLLDSIGYKFDADELLKSMDDKGIIKSIMGAWIELPYEVTLADGTKTKYIKIPDLFKMKVKPTTVQEVNDYYMMVTKSYRTILDVVTGRFANDYTSEANVSHTTPYYSPNQPKDVKEISRVKKSINGYMQARRDLNGNMMDIINSNNTLLGSKAYKTGDLANRLYMDIETTGLDSTNDSIFKIGIAYEDKATGKMVQKQFFAHNASQERDIIEAFTNFTTNFDVVHTYNGKRFDMSFIKDRAMILKREDLTNILINTRHEDIMDAVNSWSGKKKSDSKSLVATAKAILDYNREGEDVGGSMNPRLYRDYQDFLKARTAAQRDSSWEKLKKHNLDDLVATFSIHHEILNSGEMVGSTFTPRKNMEVEYMVGEMIKDRGKMTKSVQAAMDSYYTMLGEGFSKFFRGQVTGANLPGFQALMAPIPTKYLMGGEKYAKLGPIDIGISRGSNLWLDVKENIREVLKDKYGNEKHQDHYIADIDKRNSMITADLDDIESGKSKWGIQVGRHPITGPQARSLAYLKVVDNDDPHLKELLFAGQLMQHSVFGDVDFDQVQVISSASWGEQASLRDLLRYETMEGSNYNAFSVATTSTKKLKDFVKGYKPEWGDVKVPNMWEIAKDAHDPSKYNILVHDKVRGKNGKLELAGVGLSEKDISEKMNTGTFDNGMKILDDGNGNLIKIEVSDMVELLEQELKDGKNVNAAIVMNKLQGLGLDVVNNNKLANIFAHKVINLAQSQYRAQLVLQAQKGMVGSTTAYVMALNLLAQQELGGKGTKLSGELFNVIQNFLSAKKWDLDSMKVKLGEIGRFAEIATNIRDVNDYWGRQLTSEKGFGWSIESAEELAGLSSEGKKSIWKAIQTPRDILLSSDTNKENNRRKVASLMENVTAIEEGRATSPLMEDLAELFGYSVRDTELGNSLLEVADNAYGAAKSANTSTGAKVLPKSFFGKFWEGGKLTSSVENTRIAEILGKNHAEYLKGGLIGAGAIGALYMAYNFFRPNQMSMLGTMPGTGGETWGPIRGSAMELPRGVPIDTNNYSWDAPYGNPTSNRARVTPIDPVLQDKMMQLRAEIRNRVVTPITTAYSENTIPTTSGRVNRGNRY